MGRFVQDERGNFAILTGFLAILLVGSLGGIVDLSTQWIDTSNVQRAVDAAALAGAKALEYGDETDAQDALQAAAKVNLPVGFPAVTFEGKIDEKAGTVQVVGTGTIKPNFLPLFQINDLKIAASSTALIQRKSYIDFYFMLDVSESMNIAASDEDRKNLEETTRDFNNRPCAFACHEVESGWAPISVWQMNELAGTDGRHTKARLRIDVLRDAADSMIDKILAVNTQPGSLASTRVATAGFSSSFAIGMPPSTHAPLLKASIRSFPNANQHTDMQAAFAGFKNQLGSQGTGTTASSPKKVAIVVTDGVRDDSPWFDRSGLGPLDPRLCSAIKAAGIDLAVLEIKYVAIRDKDNFFRDRVSWYYDAISPSMKTCASSGLYYLASDADAARNKLLQLVDDLLTVRRRLAS